MFIVINLIFFIAMFYFVSRAGSSDASYEHIYAKKISLLINEAKQNTLMKVDVSELVYRGRKNNFKTEINIKDNLINVKVRESGGYSYSYYSDYDIESSLNYQEGFLFLRVK